MTGALHGGQCQSDEKNVSEPLTGLSAAHTCQVEDVRNFYVLRL